VPRKVFVAGEILTAADVNTNLMDQAVMSFAGTATRGSAIPSPVEGMAAYLEDSNILSLYDGSAWKNSLATTGGILQVVSATRSTSISSSSTSFIDLTDATVTLTPKDANSKFIVIFSVIRASGADNAQFFAQVARNGSGVNLVVEHGGQFNQSGHLAGVFVDSPATTSALTYKIQVRTNTGTATYHGGNIVVMEVAG
jgi:hypothetical protein